MPTTFGEYNWELISFATGTKCVNEIQLHSKSNYKLDNEEHEISVFRHRLHDSHAETLVKRAFQLYFYLLFMSRFLMEEVDGFGKTGVTSKYITFNTDSNRFSLKNGILISLYSSHIPCMF